MSRNAIAFILLPLLLAGCGTPKETTVVETADGKVTVEKSDDGDESVRIEATGADGKTVTMTAGPSATWPGDAPAYAAQLPGATVIHTMGGNDGADIGRMVMFETTKQTPAEVLAFYKDRAKAAGLGNVTEIASAGNYMFGAEDKASGRTLSVQVAAADGKTSGSVTFAVKKG
jgi:hypothetical protein